MPIPQPIFAHRFALEYSPIAEFVQDIRIDFAQKTIVIHTDVPEDTAGRQALLDENFKNHLYLNLMDRVGNVITTLEFTLPDVKRKEMQLDYGSTDRLQLRYEIGFQSCL